MVDFRHGGDVFDCVADVVDLLRTAIFCQQDVRSCMSQTITYVSSSPSPKVLQDPCIVGRLFDHIC